MKKKNGDKKMRKQERMKTGNFKDEKKMQVRAKAGAEK